MADNQTNEIPQKITLTLSIEEINLILEGLGQLPFVRVHQLITSIQQQATVQLQAKKIINP